MSIVTGDRYLEYLLRFVDKQTGPLLEGTLVLKLNPVGLHYVQSRLEALQELEGLLTGAPVDYLRAYISDLGDHRALEQVRRILRLLTSLKVVSILPPPSRDPTPISLLPFGRLKVLELRGCDLSTSAARGLLELRHTLEKIIVHNSTDALRHVFASRIADINDSPLWNKLRLVSCPCNELVLMDESLQLLPAVETLDLSRNKFAQVNNLKKCTKLKHLDLGFNHLRSISSLNEIACSIVKLVLRNNALTGLRGVEALMSLEGLDISYNIISNISELEILTSLPSIQSLWLEGNPICCAPWYRAQVFSLFAHPESLKLDEKRITTRESWKRQIVIASRLRRPAGFGFYCPAKDNDEEEGSVNTNRKKLLRLALIEDGEQSGVSPRAGEHDSLSGKSEIQSREEMVVSDNDAEIVDLMNRVECMKKEHSVLWLREFKEWMDQTSDNLVDRTKHPGLHDPDKEIHMEDREAHRPHRESPRYVSHMVHDSGDGGSTKQLESESSFGDSSIGMHAYHHFSSEMILESSIAECSGDSGTDLKTGGISLDHAQEKTSSQAQFNFDPVEKDPFLPETLASDKGVMTDSELSLIPTAVIDKMMDPQSSFSYPGSPPHYQEDILHRRHNLEEEFMQLSVESCSLASLDSDTSTSDDISCNFDTCLSGDDQLLNEEPTSKIVGDHSDAHYSEDVYNDRRHEASHVGPDERILLDSCDIQTSGEKEILDPDHICIENIDHADNQNMSIKKRRRLKRRIVSLSAEIGISNNQPPSLKLNGITEVSIGDGANENMHESDLQKFQTEYNNSSTGTAYSHAIDDETIKNYFHGNVANSSVSETCLWSTLCDCLLLRQLEYKMSKVVILLSSAKKVYMLLVDSTSDGSGIISEVVGSHKLEEIREVVIGIGLQVLRVCIEMDMTYLVLTKSVEKSRELLTVLCDCDSTSLNSKCSIISWEKVQVELFEKHICGDSETNIFLYSMLLFSCNANEESWLSRSLFLIQGYVILCIEDLVHFSSMDDALSSPYFSLDSCCYIGNISEMVIEPRDSRCVTLTLDSGRFSPERGLGNGKMLTLNEKMIVGSYKWKLKWFSEDILLKFVALLKALHAETAAHPLTVRCIS